MESPEDRSPQPSGSDGRQETNEQTIDLKLLSPSPEVPATGLYFEDLPTSTTLGELRNRIRTSLPSQPPPARQRLIYFGRVLQRDDDTLASVFGENNIQQQRQHTLHLVLPLREGNSQSQASPSPIPGPRASIYPPSSIPRPSSVPPRGTGAASPFRPGNWPSQPPTPSPTSATTTTQRPPQAASGQPAIQQPQPRAQTPLDQPIFRSMIGNANIRANITANGQPINLPPEVLNQLLNQHFLRNGVLPDLLANAQPRPHSTDPAAQATGAPPGAPTPPLQQRPSGQQLFQQFMASVNDTNRQANPSAGGDINTTEGQNRSAAPASDEERGRSNEPHDSAQEALHTTGTAPHTTGTVPTSTSTDSAQPSSTGSQSQTATAHTNGPGQTIREQSGVNADGTRWTIRTVEGQTHIHRGPQVPQMHLPMPYPQGFPMAQFQPSPGMPIPMAAPVAGLRPHGTPRSASPARSVSEGPRRVGTPAAELQHRLMHTNQEIQNLNQLLGVLAGGTMANGQPAPPLSDEQMTQIRAFADSMNAHIAGFGNDLNALANAHPTVRFQPEFAGLSAMFQAVQGQGRAISQRIDGLPTNIAQTAQAQPRSDITSAPSAGTTQEASPASAQATTQSAGTLSNSDPRTSPTQLTPSTTSDTLSPSLITRETSPTTTTAANSSGTPELHLLSDPTNTQHYLLVGPNGALGTGHLPLDVLYPLLAAQLPHDQLVRDFNRATQEMVHALQRSDIRAALQGVLTLPPSSLRGPTSSQSSSATATGDAAGNATAAAGAEPAGQPAAAAADPQQQPIVEAAINGQPQPAQQPDEMRDVLAPIVRNLWLIVRLCIFGWFFFSSGRGYGRLLVLVVLGGIVYAINAGLLGQRLNGLLGAVRQHFEDVVDEARGNLPVQAQAGRPAQTNDAGEGSSRSAAAQPTPEETARRLMVQQTEGQRRRVRDTIRQIERTVALGFASLWPGVGEAVVRNHERSRREAERAADEARKKAEEERKKAEEEMTKIQEATAIDNNAEGSTSTDIANSEGLDRVNKGKERAE